jgi:hypothetical protein
MGPYATNVLLSAHTLSEISFSLETFFFCFLFLFRPI